MNTDIIYIKSCEDMSEIPNESINCLVTSPPYWALRDYEIEQQLGLESNFTEYINKLCNIFNEVKRVLRKDGTCWVNLGDTYYGGGHNRGSTADKLSKMQYSNRGARGQVQMAWTMKYQRKSLCMIPQRFAIEMIKRKWILRNTIIWHKPNAMPSSVRDRFTVDFEYLYLFVKHRKYYFEQQKEEAYATPRSRRSLKGGTQSINNPRQNYKEGQELLGRNKRCIWSILTKPFPEAHFAVYPPELIETPIKAGCPEGGIVLDPFMGSGTTALVAKQLNRNFIGYELNPDYVDMIKKRLNKYNIKIKVD